MENLSDTGGKLMDNEQLLEIWQKVIARVGSRIGNTRAVEVWIKPVLPRSLEGQTLTLILPNRTFQKGFSAFTEPVLEACAEVLGYRPLLQFCFDDEGHSPRISSINLNPDYTFENFVVGPSNRLAHAAALAVAQTPGTAYNPLFIYGGVGLGKTHLMQAIGHFTEQQRSIHSVYLPCEVFVNAFIQAIQNKSTVQFRNKFRSLDILLIDDIHFIAGKEGTQEEFFHTFNALYDARKQIILSSDRPPKEIAQLEKRLVSRFEWGLVVDIQPPDFETRVAILKKKCQLRSLNLSDEIVFYLAEQIRENIRMLEGALNRIFALSSLLNRQVNLALTQEVVAGIYQKEKKAITLPLIMEKVSDFFHISPHDLTSRKRRRDILIPRQIAMYLAREMTEYSLVAIAEELGGKDHTTVIHAYRKIKSKIGADQYLTGVIEQIKRSLQG
ncbi:MAG TPA: chromosomal replication initiator protein DnaA [bacterium]|nr:chromosomal replication initiator protein DnaA [bacterium]HPP11953.1 chromosomal replication initiator protein DnaA [bacterium]